MKIFKNANSAVIPYLTRFLAFSAIGLCIIVCNACDYIHNISEVTKHPVSGNQMDIEGDKVESRKIDPKIANIGYLPNRTTNVDMNSNYGNNKFDYRNIDFSKPKNKVEIYSMPVGFLNAKPMIDGKYIIFMDAYGIIKCYDKISLKPIWESKFFCENGNGYISGEYINAGIAQDKDHIYAAGNSDIIVKIKKQNGDVVWKKQISGVVHEKPLVTSHGIVVQSVNGSLYSLSIKTGDLIWVNPHFRMTNGLSYGAIADRMIISNDNKHREIMITQKVPNGDLLMIDTRTGGLDMYHTSLQDPLGHGSILTNTANAFAPVLNKVTKKLIFAYNDGSLSSFDIDNQKIEWTKPLSISQEFWVTSDYTYAVNIYNQAVIVQNSTGKIKAIADLNSIVSRKVELRDIDKNRYIWTPPVVAGDVVWIARTDGILLAMNPSNLAIIKEYSIEGNIYIAPIMDNDNMYIFTADGKLVQYGR